MRCAVTTKTIARFAGSAGYMGWQKAYQDYTLLLVRMTAQQVADWAWLGDATTGTEPLEGYEVRDTTGALLGAILPLGRMATTLHVERYSPEIGDFFAAGSPPYADVTAALHRLLDARKPYDGPIATGEDFTLTTSVYLPERAKCLARTCAEDCPDC